jgi:hypothetical protein
VVEQFFAEGIDTRRSAPDNRAIQGSGPAIFCPPLLANLSLLWEGKRMTIANATLQAMIQAYYGFTLTDDEIALIRPELENYFKEVEQLRTLDLANVLSGRLLRAQEGGKA